MKRPFSNGIYPSKLNFEKFARTLWAHNDGNDSIKSSIPASDNVIDLIPAPEYVIQIY